ncbi:uncharacterized protein OCT59_024461 [Rhizophagus irregularis]|nr:hypothetical protein OCT59_024461 [Rhizophagus irregularis]GBC14249.1 hypothetical protein GLOIN_2v1771477 [Rhizophagus irregularis DAOM 181602=DAOM 197198]
MSKLNHDVLNYIFQDLFNLISTNSNNEEKYNKSLHSCLLVNKLWCEIMIPILWSYPCKYVFKKNLLFNIIISHLPDNTINNIISNLPDNTNKTLKDKNIIETNFKKQKLSFNYVRFCKYLNDIHEIFPIDSILLREELYKLFISECSFIKCLSLDMLSYNIYKYPGANISLSNLYEIYCYHKIDQDFCHGLAQICRSIEKIYVKIYGEKSSGVAKLIEMQNQIKYIFIDGPFNCKEIVQALEKHVNSIIHLEMTQYTSTIHFLIPKLINLQYLKVDDNYCELKKYVVYLNHYNLKALDLCFLSSLDIAISIIKNTNGNLWRIRIENTDNTDKAKEYNKTIHKYCPNIKYVTVFLNRDGTLKELKKNFIKCQHLEAIDINDEINTKYIDELIDLLAEFASPTLCKIHIDNIKSYYDEQTLNYFLINWGNRILGKKTSPLYSNVYYQDFAHIYNNDFWNNYITWNYKVRTAKRVRCLVVR